MSRPDPLTKLIEQLQRLPGIGAKSAGRLAFHILKTPREEVERLVEAMREVKDRVTYCSVCSNTTDIDPCVYCSSDARNHNLICVVEEPQNVTAIEKTREFKGQYHVLMGALSPLQGIGPDDLKIKSLLARITDGVQEIILATNPNVEGEATAIYLARLLKPLGVKVTRIAMGVPVGSDLDDHFTQRLGPLCVQVGPPPRPASRSATAADVILSHRPCARCRHYTGRIAAVEP